jgi:hypothetical protein
MVVPLTTVPDDEEADAAVAGSAVDVVPPGEGS